MPATSANSRSASTSGGRLPLTPNVISHRRGGHAPVRRVRTGAGAPVGVTPTPAMHITPNVVSAARGGLSLHSVTRLSDAYGSRALDMRGLRL